MIRSVQFRNLLSYGPKSEPLELQPLNVLIGPNASGKSNLLACIGLLHAAAGDFSGAVDAGGGIRHWLWKGDLGARAAALDVILDWPESDRPYHLKGRDHLSLRYHLEFAASERGLLIEDEALEYDTPTFGQSSTDFFLKRKWNPPLALGHIAKNWPIDNPQPLYGTGPIIPPGEDQCILSYRPEPQIYPATSFVSSQFHAMQLYRDWNFGPEATARKPQPSSGAAAALVEDCSNLASVVRGLSTRSRSRVVGRMKAVYEKIEDVRVLDIGGYLLPILQETGAHDPIPAPRWSDGTLRYLCLILILTSDEPPPFVCLEEPELGMHPDLIPEIASLLIDASSRMQLVVTTHSELLVSALRDVPEAIIICDSREGETRLRRLEANEAGDRTEDWDLGDLWIRGALGGTRW